MGKAFKRLSITSLACIGAVLMATGTAQAIPIKLTAITSGVVNPIGIDYFEPTNEVMISQNYPTGQPFNFATIDSGGVLTQFSSISGFTNEVKIATTRSGNANFATGTFFTGNGNDGEIVRINPDGTIHSTISLPGGSNGLIRGSLYVDRTGVYGGDLIAVTTIGEVWRVNGAGATTKVADVGNVHLEGVITVPNDVPTYGPLAGKIIAGAEVPGLMYVFDATGLVGTRDVGVKIEDIDLIEANANFFGANFNNNRILGAPASEFTSVVGDILLTQEFGNGSSLWTLAWDGVNLVSTAITLSAGSATVGQWEHVTFAPAGISEIPPVAVPEPTTLALLGLGLAGIGFSRRKAT